MNSAGRRASRSVMDGTVPRKSPAPGRASDRSRGLCSCQVAPRPGSYDHQRHHAMSDAGKEVKGRKRYIVTDTCGFLIFILIHAADIQDRDGAVDVLAARGSEKTTRRMGNMIEQIWVRKTS